MAQGHNYKHRLFSCVEFDWDLRQWISKVLDLGQLKYNVSFHCPSMTNLSTLHEKENLVIIVSVITV